jgi:hypothetical protein
LSNFASPHHLPTERLTLIISLPQSTAHEGKSGIDLLYTQVLEQAFHDVDSDEQELYSHFKLVVGAVLLVSTPFQQETLSELLKNCGTPSHISNTLRSLHSLLLVPTARLILSVSSTNPSLTSSLTQEDAKMNDSLLTLQFITPDILFLCLDLMKERLRKNICNLDGCPSLSEVEDLPAS